MKNLIAIVEAGEKGCPLATQDLELNTKNRNAAIQAEHIQYGPLNVKVPGDYFEKIAKFWKTSVDAAEKTLCNSCAAFDISPGMLECMPCLFIHI